MARKSGNSRTCDPQRLLDLTSMDELMSSLDSFSWIDSLGVLLASHKSAMSFEPRILINGCDKTSVAMALCLVFSSEERLLELLMQTDTNVLSASAIGNLTEAIGIMLRARKQYDMFGSISAAKSPVMMGCLIDTVGDAEQWKKMFEQCWDLMDHSVDVKWKLINRLVVIGSLEVEESVGVAILQLIQDTVALTGVLSIDRLFLSMLLLLLLNCTGMLCEMERVVLRGMVDLSGGKSAESTIEMQQQLVKQMEVVARRLIKGKHVAVDNDDVSFVAALVVLLSLNVQMCEGIFSGCHIESKANVLSALQVMLLVWSPMELGRLVLMPSFPMEIFSKFTPSMVPITGVLMDHLTSQLVGAASIKSAVNAVSILQKLDVRVLARHYSVLRVTMDSLHLFPFVSVVEMQTATGSLCLLKTPNNSIGFDSSNGCNVLLVRFFLAVLSADNKTNSSIARELDVMLRKQLRSSDESISAFGMHLLLARLLMEHSVESLALFGHIGVELYSDEPSCSQAAPVVVSEHIEALLTLAIPDQLAEVSDHHMALNVFCDGLTLILPVLDSAVIEIIGERICALFEVLFVRESTANATLSCISEDDDDDAATISVSLKNASTACRLFSVLVLTERRLHGSLRNVDAVLCSPVSVVPSSSAISVDDKDDNRECLGIVAWFTCLINRFAADHKDDVIKRRMQQMVNLKMNWLDRSCVHGLMRTLSRLVCLSQFSNNLKEYLHCSSSSTASLSDSTDQLNSMQIESAAVEQESLVVNVNDSKQQLKKTTITNERLVRILSEIVMPVSAIRKPAVIQDLSYRYMGNVSAALAVELSKDHTCLVAELFVRGAWTIDQSFSDELVVQWLQVLLDRFIDVDDNVLLLILALLAVLLDRSSPLLSVIAESERVNSINDNATAESFANDMDSSEATGSGLLTILMDGLCARVQDNLSMSVASRCLVLASCHIWQQCMIAAYYGQTTFINDSEHLNPLFITKFKTVYLKTKDNATLMGFLEQDPSIEKEHLFELCEWNVLKEICLNGSDQLSMDLHLKMLQVISRRLIFDLEDFAVAVFVFDHVVQHLRQQSNASTNTYKMLFRCSCEFIEGVISIKEHSRKRFRISGLSLVEHALKAGVTSDQAQLSLTVIGQLQRATRSLHVIANHCLSIQVQSTTAKSLDISKLIPKLKLALESLLPQMQGVMYRCNLLEAYQVGNLKHRRLDGKVIGSDLCS